jgi:hypothetical protein
MDACGLGETRETAARVGFEPREQRSSVAPEAHCQSADLSQLGVRLEQAFVHAVKSAKRKAGRKA